MNFVVKVLHLAIEKYTTKKHKKRGGAPSRCYISLDLRNMFNEMSRDAIFEIVSSKFPFLLPLDTLLYAKPGTIFFCMTDGK